MDPDAVLARLRVHLDDPGLTFASPLRPLTGGAFSAVFGLRLSCIDGPLVLRGQPSLAQARIEAWMHAAAGPVLAPEVLVVDESFTLLRRLPGRPFLRGVRWDQFARSFPRVVARWPAALATVVDRLHGVEPPADTPSADRHLETVSTLGDRPEVAWLLANRPTPVDRPAIVHGDLWPANVLFDGGRLTGLVDWNRAGIGDPAMDVGFAAAGLALMPVPFPPPEPLASIIGRFGRRLAEQVRAIHPDPDRVRWYEALRCLLELAEGAGGPWERSTDAVLAHFHALTA